MSRNFLFFLIILIGCLPKFASDIYAPAVPTIARDLASSLRLVQWSMVIYILGVAVSQPFYGIISEGIGRKGPLLTGLSIMFVGTLICISATSITMLILGRFIQGIGAAAGSSLWRTIFRDVYSSEDLAKYGSYLAIGVTFIIPTAPALGAYLQHFFTWRATFIFLSLYTIFLLLTVLYGYHETSQHHHLERLKSTFIKHTFGELLMSRVFMGISLSVFMAYGGLFAWIIAAPVLLIHLTGMPPLAFGWFLFAGVGSAYAMAGLLNGKLVSRFGINAMMRFGWIIMILSGILLLIGYFLWGIKTWSIAPMMILFYFGVMFIFPNTNARALTPFGKIAGYAGALYAFIQISGGVFFGGLIAHLPEPNQIPLAVVIIALSILSWLCFEWIVAQKTA